MRPVVLQLQTATYQQPSLCQYMQKCQQKSLQKMKKQTSGLGHLFSVQQQMAVAAHALGPLVRLSLPNGCVIVQGKAQMVVDEVLA